MRDNSNKYFHKLPERFNCAQSVLKGFQKELNVSEETVGQFKANGGGRSPNGVCGALYAANFLLKQIGKDEITEQFEAKVGSIGCREIRGEKLCSCEQCVQIADELLEKQL